MKVYRVFAYLVAAAVAFQAATIAYALFALGSWVEKGGVLDKAAMEGGGGVPGEGGFAGHGYGAIAVAVFALALLVTSFFVRFPGGIKWAAIVFGLVVLQWALAFASFAVAGLGVLHGINALAVLGTAMTAAALAGRAARGRHGEVPVAEPARVDS
jgi:hypothetical protein